MLFAKSTFGFYSEEIHGAFKLTIVDPNWIRPQVDGVDDQDAVPDTIIVDNPDCKIPPDAVEITDELYCALLDAQASGKIISTDKKGNPILIDRVVTAEQLNAPILAQLAEIDAKKIRAISDAILTQDNSKLIQLEDDAKALRSQITK